MLHEDLINFYRTIEIKVNPHIEAEQSIRLYVSGLCDDHMDALKLMFSDASPQETIIVDVVTEAIVKCERDEMLVVASFVYGLNSDEKQFRVFAPSLGVISAYLILLKRAITDPPIDYPSRYKIPALPVVSEHFDSVTFRINPHKTTGLKIADYIQDYNGKGLDDSYTCDDNRFSDDPAYESELNLCSASNRIYTVTAYWKDVDGNRMCRDAFAHDYMTVLKELHEIADERSK